MTIEATLDNIQDLLTEIMKSGQKQEELLKMFIAGVKEWKIEDERQHSERLPAYKETTEAIRELIGLFQGLKNVRGEPHGEKEAEEKAVGLTLPAAR